MKDTQGFHWPARWEDLFLWGVGGKALCYTLALVLDDGYFMIVIIIWIQAVLYYYLFGSEGFFTDVGIGWPDLMISDNDVWLQCWQYSTYIFPSFDAPKGCSGNKYTNNDTTWNDGLYLFWLLFILFYHGFWVVIYESVGTLILFLNCIIIYFVL